MGFTATTDDVEDAVMAWPQQLRRLYAVDTLDTRFTTASKPGQRLPAPSRADERLDGSGVASTQRPVADSASQPSRWHTIEFPVYYTVVFIAVAAMLKVTYDVSKEDHPNFSAYSELLSPGWIPGRKIDNSDAQYSNFRNNIPSLILVLGLHLLLRRFYYQVFPVPPAEAVRQSISLTEQDGSPSRSYAPAPRVEPRFEQRITFDVLFSILFVFVLHGSSAFKIALVLWANYSLAKRLPRHYVPLATWCFNILVLFANELNKGYKYTRMVELASLGTAGSRGPLTGWAEWLDGHGGLVSRWEISFNVTVLRLISFNLDYYWSLAANGHDLYEKKQLEPEHLSERDRVTLPARPEHYSFRNYVAYALYPPLYLAGPIVTFNDYVAQTRHTPSSITTTRITLYGVRWLICLLCMEMMQHFLYVVAISKSHPVWTGYTPFQLSMIGFFNLFFIWLKLLLPWRLFRLWALLDGVDPPENMVRCMADNYSALAFWRGWHRSFNRWCVRYIYLPLGGSATPSGRGRFSRLRTLANYVVVFTFVAVWHDINLRLLVWGWLITLFILPEVLAVLLFPRRSWSSRPDAYRILCGVGAVGNILMMMAANLVGFAVGVDGTKGLVQGILGSPSGLAFLVVACATLFAGVQVMFELRERERRAGIDMKC